MYSRIESIAYYLPSIKLGNDDLAAVGTSGHSAADLFRFSGVKERSIASLGELPSDMAFQAAEGLFEKMPCGSRDKVDGLIFCSQILDQRSPATAALIHRRLGLGRRCFAIDQPAACTGFMNGLMLAKALVESGQARQVLLLTAEKPSAGFSSSDDVALQAIFGDGAAATLIVGAPEKCIGEFVYATDSMHADALVVDRSGARQPPDVEWLRRYSASRGLPLGRMSMDGERIFRASLSLVPPLLNELLERNSIDDNQVAMYVFHQASAIVLEGLRRKCKIPKDRFLVTLEGMGNLVSASIPAALALALESGRLVRGDLLVLVAFGAGFSVAGTALYL